MPATARSLAFVSPKSNTILRLCALMAVFCIVSWISASRSMNSYADQIKTKADELPQFDMNNLVDGSGQDASAQQGHRRNQSLIAMTDEEGSAMNMDMNIDMNMEEGLPYSQVPWDGIENAEWCRAPVEPRLPYDDCQWDSFVFEFGVHGGLTNALHFVLKGAIWAFEEGVCFFVNEKGPQPAKLAQRSPIENSVYPFLERYFEPIGMNTDSPNYKKAMKYHKVINPSYHQIQDHEFGRRSGGLTAIDNPIRHKIRSIESLDWFDMDNIFIKKKMLRSLFRILPEKQDIACSRLSALGLQKEYIALSVRRGDKILEFALESSLQPYIDRAEIAVKTHFGGFVPPIFVASDDCSVMQELRDLRPDWNFVGECDHATEQNGFVIAEMKDWSLEQTDRHYEKFITEMIAMASAKFWIGVSTTNVAFWMYYMRHYDAGDDSFVFVDTTKAVH